MVHNDRTDNVVTDKPTLLAGEKKDIWDKLDILGKILIAPLLVGIVGFMASYALSHSQQEISTANKEFELAITVLTKPRSKDEDASIAVARNWAEKTLRNRLGEDFPVSEVTKAARRGIPIDSLSNKELFSALMSGEVDEEALLNDPRYAKCISADRELDRQCVLRKKFELNRDSSKSE